MLYRSGKKKRNKIKTVSPKLAVKLTTKGNIAFFTLFKMVFTWRHSSHIGEQKNEMAVMLLHVGIKLFSNVKNFLCWVQFHYIDRIAHTFRAENFRLRSHPEVSGMLQSELSGMKIFGFRIPNYTTFSSSKTLISTLSSVRDTINSQDTV